MTSKEGSRQPRSDTREALAHEFRRASLAAHPFFQTMRPAELDGLLKHAVTRRFAAGTSIMRRGEDSASMAVILIGRVRVGCTTEEGQEIMLGILGPGDVIGEMGLLDGESRSADIDAMDDCTLLSIDRGWFLAMLRGNVELCLRLLAHFCARVRRANVALEELALLDLPSRLGRLLLRLAQDYGVSSERGVRIELKVSQRDLGNLVGSSRVKVNQHLRQWEREKIIGKEHGHLVIFEPDRLAVCAALLPSTVVPK